MKPMIHPNPDMILRIAQADACAGAVEYLRLPSHRGVLEEALQFTHYVAHPTHGRPGGYYSDDAQMMVAVAYVMLERPKGPDGYTKLQYADSLVRTYQQDRRSGYNRKFKEFLDSYKAATGELFLQNIRPDSEKNGAAIRSVPIGILRDPGDVINAALVNASITHNTHEGRISSVVVALLSHFALYTDEPFSAFSQWVERTCTSLAPVFVQDIVRICRRPWHEAVTSSRYCSLARATTCAVFTLLTTTSTLQESMLKGMRWGGDVDSVMAITWGIQSTRVRDPLPDWLETGLEEGPYGLRFLQQMGHDLMVKYA